MGKQTDKVSKLLKLPAETAEQVQARADAALRSWTAQVIYELEANHKE